MDIDGLFDAPATTTAAAPADVDDDMFEGGFDSLDELLKAEQPSPEEADGAPVPEIDVPMPPAAKAAAPKAPSAASATTSDGWSITIDLKLIQRITQAIAAVTLRSCAAVNRPVEPLSDEMKQTIGWVALAVAGPGAGLIAYALIFA